MNIALNCKHLELILSKEDIQFKAFLKFTFLMPFQNSQNQKKIMKACKLKQWNLPNSLKNSTTWSKRKKTWNDWSLKDKLKLLLFNYLSLIIWALHVAKCTSLIFLSLKVLFAFLWFSTRFKYSLFPWKGLKHCKQGVKFVNTPSLRRTQVSLFRDRGQDQMYGLF